MVHKKFHLLMNFQYPKCDIFSILNVIFKTLIFSLILIHQLKVIYSPSYNSNPISKMTLIAHIILCYSSMTKVLKKKLRIFLNKFGRTLKSILSSWKTVNPLLNFKNNLDQNINILRFNLWSKNILRYDHLCSCNYSIRIKCNNFWTTQID